MAQGIRRYPCLYASMDTQAYSCIVGESCSPLYGSADVTERALQVGKVQNLRRAAQRLHGLCLPANATFSFWKQVGLATRRRGYVQGRQTARGVSVPGHRRRAVPTLECPVRRGSPSGMRDHRAPSAHADRSRFRRIEGTRCRCRLELHRPPVSRRRPSVPGRDFDRTGVGRTFPRREKHAGKHGRERAKGREYGANSTCCKQHSPPQFGGQAARDTGAGA